MTTETILTESEVNRLQISRPSLVPLFEVVGFSELLYFARAIEQAVLQSPEIQALKKDAGRYRWLRDGGNDDIGVVRGFDSVDCGSTSVASTYEEGLDGEHLDDAIDEPMEKNQ